VIFLYKFLQVRGKLKGDGAAIHNFSYLRQFSATQYWQVETRNRRL